MFTSEMLTDRQIDRRTLQSNSRVGYTQPAQKHNKSEKEKRQILGINNYCKLLSPDTYMYTLATKQKCMDILIDLRIVIKGIHKSPLYNCTLVYVVWE